MRVVVTGATGLIGQKLCKELLKRNYALVVIGRSPESKFREHFTLPCEYHLWDKLKLENIHAVFHLAGEPIAGTRWTSKKKNSIVKSRTETTELLYRAFDTDWPTSFICASAIGYYGDRGDEMLKEQSSPGTNFLSHVCKTWEASTQIFQKNSRLVQLRIGLVLDPKGGFLEPIEKIFSLGLGGKLGNGKQWMSWIHIEDLIRMMIYALEKPIEGVFNAVTPKPITNAEWTKKFAMQLKVNTFPPIPLFFLKLLLGEMSQLATNSQKVSSDKIQSTGFDFLYKNISDALRQIYTWKQKPSEKIFYTEQWIPQKKDDIFPFFSKAKNLETITPPWLKFKVLKQSSPQMAEGTIIDYKISLKGIPLKWKTEIKEWNPPHYFTDDQLKGPYKRWYHTHLFEEFPQGTLMKDQIVYEIPCGRIGQLLLGSYIRKDIIRIFAYRKLTIKKCKLSET